MHTEGTRGTHRLSRGVARSSRSNAARTAPFARSQHRARVHRCSCRSRCPCRSCRARPSCVVCVKPLHGALVGQCMAEDAHEALASRALRSYASLAYVPAGLHHVRAARAARTASLPSTDSAGARRPRGRHAPAPPRRRCCVSRVTVRVAFARCVLLVLSLPSSLARRKGRSRTCRYAPRTATTRVAV